jgi:hypothetical protein
MDAIIYDKVSLDMSDIAAVCLSSALVILVFAVNLKIQAVVMRKQTQAVQHQIDLARVFYRVACVVFAAGILELLAVLLCPHLKILSGYWIPGGITLFAFAGTLIVWWKKLTINDQVKLGQEINIASTILIITALVVFFFGIIQAEAGGEAKMIELSGEAMMALFISSTAFTGLTAIVVGQVLRRDDAQRAMAKELIASFAAGIAAAVFSFGWFWAQYLVFQLIATIAFLVQLALCCSGVRHFWRT